MSSGSCWRPLPRGLLLPLVTLVTGDATSPDPQPARAVFPLGRRSVVFDAPLQVLLARRAEDVVPLLAEVQRAVDDGLWAAGMSAYEAASGFDPALVTAPAGTLPLAWFGIFAAPRLVTSGVASGPAGFEQAGEPLQLSALDWRPSLTGAAHAEAVAAVHAAIARGDTYQVNLTWRLRAPFTGSPAALFAGLLAAQPVRYAAYLDIGSHVLCSASPELFFRRSGSRLESRPMKGTARRGRHPAEDAALAKELEASAKERAENLMIVDMVRNDLARVARPGSVETPRLWQLERYSTVWQLTSTVRAESTASLPELMRAMFPAASITGAPKAAAMRQIAKLERDPRGIYTGAIGWVGPGGRARFGVAIRTACVDRGRGEVEYGTGGGITWDSTPAAELAESRLKATILLAPRRDFDLLETLLWWPGRGYWLLGEHLARLRASARHFGYRCPPTVERELAAFAAGLPPTAQRVRLRLGQHGTVALDAAPMPAGESVGARRGGRRSWRVALAPAPIDPSDALLFHKTTRREVYDLARAAVPGCDDALLWNPAGEITESTVANLVVRLGGRLVTPPVSCGLLAGTLRARLLARETLVEQVVRIEDLARAEGSWLVNGLRGWVPMTVVGSPDEAARPQLPGP
jgi:para-aminobenzoate synthetase/4-amino-4-deoxychorismate lyase